jgi:YbgC/YbaW family acyl-CoA thioester hydrolase
MQRSEFRHLERLRVRWAEVDPQQVVFNGHYLMYFDTAVAGYWRALALPYAQTLESLDGDLHVRKATLQYLGPARYDEALEVGIRCARIGSSSMQWQAAVFRDGRCLVEGELVYVFVDARTRKSRPVPEPVRALLEAYEAGAPVVELRSGSWAGLAASILAVRRSAFEAGLLPAAACEADADDAQAWHAVAFNGLGLAVATGRLLEAPAALPATAAKGVRDPVGRIGRLATLAPLRGAGLGRQVLDALVGQARRRGDAALVLSALAEAVPFYERAGFRSLAAPRLEAGLPHIEMRLDLNN